MSWLLKRNWPFKFLWSNVLVAELVVGTLEGLWQYRITDSRRRWWWWYCSFSGEDSWGRATTYPAYICIDKKFHKLKVLNINYINTDWSILFFFDLKDYISYCKDVYKYFNLSSVNFFVAGLKYCLFFSMALWQWTLYYFNITQAVGRNSDHKMCIAFTSILLGWRFYRFSKKCLLNPLHPAYFLFSNIKHILFYIITKHWNV